MIIDEFLTRLGRVRQLPSGQYQASCPCPVHQHGDRSGGLRVKEGMDGRIVLYCFAGCGAEEITEAMGLTLSDLFSPLETIGEYRSPGRQKYLSKEVWLAVSVDAVTCSLVLDQALQGKSFTPSDLDAARAASARLWQFTQRQAGVNL